MQCNPVSCHDEKPMTCGAICGEPEPQSSNVDEQFDLQDPSEGTQSHENRKKQLSII